MVMLGSFPQTTHLVVQCGSTYFFHTSGPFLVAKAGGNGNKCALLHKKEVKVWEESGCSYLVKGLVKAVK